MHTKISFPFPYLRITHSRCALCSLQFLRFLALRTQKQIQIYLGLKFPKYSIRIWRFISDMPLSASKHMTTFTSPLIHNHHAVTTPHGCRLLILTASRFRSFHLLLSTRVIWGRTPAPTPSFLPLSVYINSLPFSVRSTIYSHFHFLPSFPLIHSLLEP